MAEHSLQGPIIGIALDGTGYGTDGKVWGGEVLIARTQISSASDICAMWLCRGLRRYTSAVAHGLRALLAALGDDAMVA